MEGVHRCLRPCLRQFMGRGGDSSSSSVLAWAWASWSRCSWSTDLPAARESRSAKSFPKLRRVRRCLRAARPLTTAGAGHHLTLLCRLSSTPTMVLALALTAELNG
jgi:hypothetical protein